MSDEPVPTGDPWQALRRFTAARIALGRAGGSLPTRALLDFQQAHAAARDAVHHPFDADGLERRCELAGHAVLRVHSAAPSRESYLQRPDLGRRLDADSRARLLDAHRTPAGPPDAVFVLADGLSPLAVQRHAFEVFELASSALADRGWRIGPVVIAEQARVALADEVGELLGARQAAILLGERPGLSSPDSLGVYLTFAPRVGRSDAQRNCISNVRPEGLPGERAAHTLVWLMLEAERLGLTGVELKDGSASAPPLLATAPAQSGERG
jgi:ethanolamine ammonia-lyase small subunit